MSSDFILEVVVGTYEEYLLCYKLSKEKEVYNLTLTVANHSHKASIRALAASKNLLVSGGADETVHIYDILERKTTGVLSHHSGTITCLEFTPDGTYLMTGSEDGCLTLTKTGSWKVDKVWNIAHKNMGVIWFSIHPSGKLALSLGKDLTVRTWNLVSGRRAFTVNLKNKCGPGVSSVIWSPDGSYFAISYDRSVDIYSTSSASVIRTLKLASKVTSIVFVQEKVVVASDNSGRIFGFDCESGAELWKVETLGSDEGDKKTGTIRGTSNRVRCLAFYKHSNNNFLIAASTLGRISVYKIPEEGEPEMLATADSKCRITCLTVMNQYRIHGSKKRALEKNEEAFHVEDGDREVEESRKKENRKAKGNVSDLGVQCSPVSQIWRVQPIKS